ncbi:MAG: hypothetical protein HQ592_07615, partial [Planctomycetes bacterium]|nr:hypothetical protein [Planctomycetota bacterium]
MNGRERELAAIRHEPCDRVPIDCMAFDNGEALAAHLGVPVADARRAMQLDGVAVGAAYTGPRPEPRDGIGFTEWNTPRTGDYATWRKYPFSCASTLADVERHVWPDPEAYDVDGAARTARSFADRLAVRGPGWNPLFCRVCDLFGMEEAMVAMMIKPAVFESVIDRVFAHTYCLCERLLDACGDAMPILTLGDDFATQSGMMIDPANWRRYLKPRYAKLFEIAKTRGRYVWFHACGNILEVLPDLIDIGVDVWETVQLHTLPITPEQLKREYGRHITFFGAINTQRLPFMRPQEVRTEVRRCIRALGEGGGYICGPDHHLKPDVSPENTIALFD